MSERLEFYRRRAKLFRYTTVKIVIRQTINIKMCCINCGPSCVWLDGRFCRIWQRIPIIRLRKKKVRKMIELRVEWKVLKIDRFFILFVACIYPSCIDLLKYLFWKGYPYLRGYCINFLKVNTVVKSLFIRLVVFIISFYVDTLILQ